MELQVFQEFADDLSAEQRVRFEHLVGEVFERRREKLRQRDGKAACSQREQPRASIEASKRRSDDEAEAVRYEDIGNGVQLRRAEYSRIGSRSAADRPEIDAEMADGGRRHRSSPDRVTSPEFDVCRSERQSRARERTVEFCQLPPSRHQSEYETASESPPRERRRVNRRRSTDRESSDPLGRETERRDNDNSSPTGSSPPRRTRSGVHVTPTPMDQGKKSNNFTFNASRQVGKFDGKSEPLESFVSKFESCSKYI